MPHLKKLSLLNFKNYAEAELELSPEVNCFAGFNGSGKTNLLDAIYYMSFCKSYFNPIDSQNIRHDEAFFVIQGTFEKKDKEERVYCGLKKGQKKQFKRNKKEYERLADHIGLFPAVIISPSDVDLIKEGSEFRRKFMDGIISQYDRAYLSWLIDYNKALSQRNHLLKTFAEQRYFDADSLDIWDAQLIDLSRKIHKERSRFMEEFMPEFNALYKAISGGNEEVMITYKSQLNEGVFEEKFKSHLDRDRSFQRTTAGIHKDDLLFEIGGHPMKKFGSQGQQKSFLISLKLGQFRFIRQISGLTPILLLDDIFDKIDDQRVSYLMQLVTNHEFGQIFITDTDPDRVPSIFDSTDVDLKVFEVEEGSVAPVKQEVEK